MAMTKVSEVTVGSGGAASIEFTGIAGTAKDLLLLVSARTNWNVDAADTLKVEFNNVTTGYSARVLRGNGSSSSSATRTFVPSIATMANNTANTFGNSSVYVANYAGTVAKSISTDSVVENNATLSYQTIEASSSNITSAITSVKLLPENGTSFVQHSSVSLYLIS